MPLPPALVKRPASDPVRVSGFPPAAAVPVLGACFGEFLRRDRKMYEDLVRDAGVKFQE